MDEPDQCINTNPALTINRIGLDMTAKAILTAARARETLNYDAETGVFTRKIRLAQRHQVGDRADFLISSGNNIGYYRVSVDSQRYLAHRVAWLYVYGEWPADMIDHINGNKSDTRIANLRLADAGLNMENMREPRSGNKSGFLGVFYHQQANKWRARIQVNRRGIHLGLFDTPEEARDAYLAGKRKYHEGCTI